MIRDLKTAISKAIKQELKLDIKLADILVEHPENESFGDYTTNIAYKLTKLSKNIKPDQIADKICKNLQKQNNPFIDNVAVVNNFINISIKNEFFITHVLQVLKQGGSFGQSDTLKGKKIMVEFAHPNTHKSFHIGHMRNIATGESLVRVLEKNGAKVIRSNYQGDVGMHIAKAIYGLLNTSDLDKQISNLKTLDEKTEFLAKAYVKGNKDYEEDEKAKKTIKDINYLVYAAAQKYQEKEKGIKPGSTNYLKFVEGKNVQLTQVYDLWVKTRKWSLDYFDTIYKRVYTHYDRFYFESEGLSGVDESYKALKKGVLKKSKGAVVFDGDPYGLDTRVFINNLGLPTYEGKELALAPKELSEFGHIDKLIHVVAPEHKSFFQTTFKVEELLGVQKDQQYHLSYGWVRLKKGKMSSRKGNIVLGEDLIDVAKKQILKTYPKVEDEVAEIIAVGAVKYSFLKQGVDKDMAFDFEESISISGNSGPYLQYTYARCKSVLNKAKIKTLKLENEKIKISPEEEKVLKWLSRYPEAVQKAGEQYSPSFIANFLYELGQRYNSFYNKHKILKAKDKKTQTLRLVLTKSVSIILQNGLYLLGIKAPEKM
ncbi:arginine--tRNA ligase [Patescibacteria group bacterium]